MLKVIEINIDQAASAKLMQAIKPLSQNVELSKLVKTPIVTHAHAVVVEDTYRFAAKALSDCLGDSFAETVQRFGQGDGHVLSISGLPWQKHYADYSRDTHRGAPPTEIIYFGLARLMGAQGAYDLRLDYVRDGNDDNLHQDGAYRQPGIYGTTYHQTDFLAIACLNPGEIEGVSTLYADLHSVIQSLPEDIISALQQHDFLPKNGTSFRPMIWKSAGRWALNPEFETFNPFASGLMSSNGMVVRNAAAKGALDKIKKVYPQNDGTCYQVEWSPGRMIVANQSGVYHRRAGRPGMKSAKRLLARARIFKSDAPQIAAERATLSASQIQSRLRRLYRSEHYQDAFRKVKKDIAVWRESVPQFDRHAGHQHHIATPPKLPAGLEIQKSPDFV